MSPDSQFYTKTATNFIEGHGLVTPNYYPFDENTPESYTAIWPPGYPFLIATFSYLSGFNVFISSKIVNAIFLGLIFILLYYWYGPNSFLPACYFCSFSKLELFSYTWSEGVFLFFLLLILFSAEKILLSKSTLTNSFLLIIALVSLVLLRYAGLIFFFYLAIVLIILIASNKYDIAKLLFIIISISGILLSCFFLINYFLSGGFFGKEPRIFPENESWIFFFNLLFNGIINELFITRNFYWTWDWMFVVTLAVQILVCFYIITKRKQLNLKSLKGINNQFIISAGLFYLVFIIILRKLSPFDAFDYRILAPFSTPIFISLLGNLRLKENYSKRYDIKLVLSSFFILSLILNLPKTFVLKWIGII